MGARPAADKSNRPPGVKQTVNPTVIPAPVYQPNSDGLKTGVLLPYSTLKSGFWGTNRGRGYCGHGGFKLNHKTGFPELPTVNERWVAGVFHELPAAPVLGHSEFYLFSKRQIHA